MTVLFTIYHEERERFLVFYQLSSLCSLSTLLTPLPLLHPTNSSSPPHHLHHDSMKISAVVIVAFAFFARDAEGQKVKGNKAFTSVCTQACDDPKQVKVCKTTNPTVDSLLKETVCVNKIAADRLVKRAKTKFVCDECQP
jgi:hypothetical protein